MLDTIQHVLMIRLLGLQAQRDIVVVLMSERLFMHDGVGDAGRMNFDGRCQGGRDRLHQQNPTHQAGKPSASHRKMLSADEMPHTQNYGQALRRRLPSTDPSGGSRSWPDAQSNAMSFIAFLVAATVLAITPGPGIAYVVALTVAGGRRIFPTLDTRGLSPLRRRCAPCAAVLGAA